MIEPTIVDFAPVEVLYVRKQGDYMVSAGEAFEVLMAFAYTQRMKHGKNLMGESAQLFGIGHDDPKTTPPEELRYDACISYDDPTVEPQGEVGAKTIAGGKYLYYLHKGDYAGLADVYAQLMHFIIENEMTMADRPTFERYLNRDPRRTKPENLRTEIYIPLKE